MIFLQFWNQKIFQKNAFSGKKRHFRIPKGNFLTAILGILAGKYAIFFGFFLAKKPDFWPWKEGGLHGVVKIN